MSQISIALVMLLMIPAAASAAGTAAKPRVRLETSKGVIVLELDAEKAPKTVANFLQYVKAGHYDGTVFHRVIPNFMIQGGGYVVADLSQKKVGAPVQNEADNGLLNQRGTVAMARTGDPHSATSQFFINLKDNTFLNHTGKNAQGWGYTVFGKTVEGMDVVDQIAAVKTGPKGPFDKDVPLEAVVIKKATVVAAQ